MGYSIYLTKYGLQDSFWRASSGPFAQQLDLAKSSACLKMKSTVSQNIDYWLNKIKTLNAKKAKKGLATLERAQLVQAQKKLDEKYGERDALRDEVSTLFEKGKEEAHQHNKKVAAGGESLDEDIRGMKTAIEEHNNDMRERLNNASFTRYKQEAAKQRKLIYQLASNDGSGFVLSPISVKYMWETWYTCTRFSISYVQILG